MGGRQTRPHCKRSRPRASQLANALHLLPHGGTAHDAVGVKLYPHRLGVEVIEIHLHFKYVLLATCLKRHFAEA